MSANSPLVFGHRGAKGLAQENSLAGFAQAIELGVDGVEFDTHLSKDCTVFVIHDAALARTTTGRGRIGTKSTAEIGSLTLKHGGGKVPTLDEALDLLAPSSLLFNIEIKTATRRRSYPGIEAAIAGSLRSRGLLQRSIISSFDWSGLSAFLAEARPHLTLGLLNASMLRRIGGPGEGLRRARKAGLNGICIPVTSLEAAQNRPDGVVWVYASDEPAMIARALSAGVDAIITDRPDIALSLREASLPAPR